MNKGELNSQLIFKSSITAKTSVAAFAAPNAEIPCRMIIVRITKNPPFEALCEKWTGV